MRDIRIGCVVIALLSLASASVRGQSYSNREYHYSMTVPSGWTNIPQETLEAMPKLVGMPGANAPQYEAGFKRSADIFLAYPYVLVQTVQGSGTLDQLEREVQQINAKPPDLSQQVKPEFAPSSSKMQAQLDRDRKRVVTKFSMTLPSGEVVRAVSFGYLGKNGLTNIHCYAAADKFAASEPVFQALADSFRFEPGYEYAERSILGGAGSGAVRGGVIGAIVGAVVYVIAKARKKAA